MRKWPFGATHASRKQSVCCLEKNCVREWQKCASLASKLLRYTKIYGSKCERNCDKQQDWIFNEMPAFNNSAFDNSSAREFSSRGIQSPLREENPFKSSNAR